MPAARGRYSRGYLPHLDVGAKPQFLTWRLADSVPQSLIESWREEIEGLPKSERKARLSGQIERYCDLGHGSCFLSQPPVARIVQESLFHDHESRYELHAWVVMPNHVHVLLTPCEGISLEEILRVGKSVTATAINKHFGMKGRLWEPDYFDRLIRNPDHFERVRHYIEWNPVKAKLCQDPTLHPWSSANANALKRLETLKPPKRSAGP
ncbi:MAG: transposase [Fimbriimonas sp.]